MTAPSEADLSLIALAAVFAPARAGALLARVASAAPEALTLAAAKAARAPRRDRLTSLAASLGRLGRPPAERVAELAASERPRVAAALRAVAGAADRTAGAPTPRRLLTRLLRERATEGPGRGTALPTEPRTGVRGQGLDLAGAPGGTTLERRRSDMLPFELPHIPAGFARLTPAARAIGSRTASAAERALGALAGASVRVAGTPRPCAPTLWGGTVRLPIELTALPGTAAIEVEAPLAIALLDLLAGGQGVVEPATEVTPLERAALELAVLACLEDGALPPEVEERLAPRLARTGCGPISGLVVELSIALGGHAGRARLVLPPAAVTALGRHSAATPLAAAIPLELSLRGGSAPILPEELAALEVGDVVLLDPRPADRLGAVAPGGLRFEGTATDDALHIEEIHMPDAHDHYPITLEVELARVPIALGELTRLEPGAVLPLPIDRRGTVTIKLGDRTLGRGQLVDVDGAVGVRIDELAGVRP